MHGPPHLQLQFLPSNPTQHVIVLVPCGLASRSHLKLIILLNNENLVNSWLKSDVSYAISVSFEVPFKEVIKLGLFLVNPSWVPAIPASFHIRGHGILVKNMGSGVRTPQAQDPAP